MADVTRFAPSPTGRLHLGHAWSALFAARAAGPEGRFLLRIEDIDPVRCRPEFTAAILEDLAWLGLRWETPVRHQSAHLADYAAALGRLRELGVIYPCFCTRTDIQREIGDIHRAPHGPDGALLYPGTCRALPADEAATREAAEPHALRLDMARAMALAGNALAWTDLARGAQQAAPQMFGDVVLARKDTPTSYHLAVTVDDALQGITLVTRGVDLFEATHVHRLLQALLGLPTPRYHHHALLTGPDGKRFAKRDQSLTLRALRESGLSVKEVLGMLDGKTEVSPGTT
ncbi:MAG: tRNA glutamyl-Q(34) synthetase GluQRS [Rhodospirillaceae bacterium]